MSWLAMNWAELHLDTKSHIPLYRQISEQIAGRIRNGGLPDGTRLLPTRELAGVLGLNRTTVAAAYEALEKNGLLQAHVGRGTFVSFAPQNGRFEWQGRFHTAASGRFLTSLPRPGGTGWIDFSSCQLAYDPAALRALRAAASREFEEHGDAILRLGASAGYPPLRAQLTSEMDDDGLLGPGDELLITSGCQQGLDLVAKTLITPGDTVLLEDPVYPGARDLFLAAGAEVHGVAVGPDGLSLADLEHELTRRRPSLLLVTPNFQNPTGATLPLDARRELLALAARFQVPVVENDVYAGLRYRGAELPSLKSLDRDGRVIYLRSFSKVAFPGLRVGWCVAPQAVARRLLGAKQLTDLHTDHLSQAVLHRLQAEGALEAHHRQVRRRGAERLTAVLEACRHLPAGVVLHVPEGGLHLWLKLPEPLEAAELLGRAQAEKVFFVPGRVFDVTRSHPGALRLTFAGLAPDKIRRGVAVLGRLVGAQTPVAAGLSEGGTPALV